MLLFTSMLVDISIIAQLPSIFYIIIHIIRLLALIFITDSSCSDVVSCRISISNAIVLIFILYIISRLRLSSLIIIGLTSLCLFEFLRFGYLLHSLSPEFIPLFSLSTNQPMLFYPQHPIASLQHFLQSSNHTATSYTYQSAYTHFLILSLNFPSFWDLGLSPPLSSLKISFSSTFQSARMKS